MPRGSYRKSVKPARVETPTHIYEHARALIGPEALRVTDRKTGVVLLETTGELGSFTGSHFDFAAVEGPVTVTKEGGCACGVPTIVTEK